MFLRPKEKKGDFLNDNTSSGGHIFFCNSKNETPKWLTAVIKVIGMFLYDRIIVFINSALEL